MGFSGIVVVARADRPLTELAAIRACGGARVWAGVDGSKVASGWQAVQISDADDDPPPSLVTDTGAPTLVARVVDSDFAVIQATSPAGTSWIGVLGQDQAQRHRVPEEFLVPPEEVLDPAVAWARETGRQPDSDRLEDVLQAEPEPTAESLVFELLGALGFDFDVPAA
ncbi:MAG TPA: hypothetical protein VHX38_08910 [Pseudonocardiaceae bacterium]|jgi:hypothetical protein|nr:hypothetical protein [Pseudonocardiaceae bacterium]